MIKLEPVTKLDQIKQGDFIVVYDGHKVIAANAKVLIETDQDGVKVIINIKKNKFFNVGMFLNGKSWVKELSIASIETTKQDR